MKIICNLIFTCMLLTSNATANNIQVSNVRLTGQNTTDDFTMVEFDISWENSWRYSNGPANWDAAWVFVKYSISNNGIWKHANLHNAGHISCSNSIINNGILNPSLPFDPITNPNVGVFLYRSMVGSGTFSCQDIQLRWNYGVNEVPDMAQVNINVYAIEMVYVPQGSFALGSGGTETYAFYTSPNPNTPYQINAENVSIVIGSNNGNLYYNAVSPVNGGDQLGPVPAEYPKGYKAFYSMKYEVSQKGYVDFLNTLTRTQQLTRVATDINGTSITNEFVMNATTNPSFRNGISCRQVIPPAPGPVDFFCDLNNNALPNESTDGLAIGCSYLSYGDLSAYLDWAALRLMTEFEFEKCARGPDPPTSNEFAWGNNVVYQHTGLTNVGQVDEAPVLSNANLAGTSSGGPLRNGTFARPASNRTNSGAGYYGCMELSGNLFERCVSIGNPAGRSYTGMHGNGMLTANGNQDVNSWPSVSDAVGSGIRGGSWDNVIGYCMISDRITGASATTSRLFGYGGRGVRTAP